MPVSDDVDPLKVVQADPPLKEEPSGGDNAARRAVPVLAFTADMVAVVTCVLAVFDVQDAAVLAIAFGAVGAALALYYFFSMEKKTHRNTALVSMLLILALLAGAGGVASHFFDFSVRVKGGQAVAAEGATPQPVTSSSAPLSSSSPVQPPPSLPSPLLPSAPPILSPSPSPQSSPSPQGKITSPAQGEKISRCVTAKGSGLPAPNHVRRVGVRTFDPDRYYPLRSLQYVGSAWTTVGQLTVGASGDVNMKFEVVLLEIPFLVSKEYEEGSSVARTKEDLARDGVQIIHSVPVERLGKVEGSCS